MKRKYNPRVHQSLALFWQNALLYHKALRQTGISTLFFFCSCATLKELFIEWRSFSCPYSSVNHDFALLHIVVVAHIIIVGHHNQDEESRSVPRPPSVPVVVVVSSILSPRQSRWRHSLMALSDGYADKDRLMETAAAAASASFLYTHTTTTTLMGHIYMKIYKKETFSSSSMSSRDCL